MFRTITPKATGRTSDETLKDKVRMSVLKTDKKNRSLQVQFKIGVNVAERMDWTRGDKMEIQIDSKPQIFKILKSSKGDGFNLGASIGKKKTAKAPRVFNLGFASREDLTPFIRETHGVKLMRYSFDPDGNSLLVWYER